MGEGVFAQAGWKGAARSIIGFVVAAVVLLGLLIYVAPIVWMTLTSFKPSSEILSTKFDLLPNSWNIQAYSQIVGLGFLRYIANSAIVAGVSTLLSTVLAIFAAYGFARFRFRMNRALLTIVILSQLVPFVVLVTPVYVLFAAVGLTDSLVGLTLAYTAVSLPFSTYMIFSYMSSIPKDLDEAARVDGANAMTILVHVIVPLLWPGTVTAAIYAFTRGWEEFLLATALISSNEKSTLQLGLASLFGQFTTSWNIVMAASTVSTLPTLVVFIVLQRKLISGLTAGAVR